MLTLNHGQTKSEHIAERVKLELGLTISPKGVVQDPGKFEGEEVFTPYFYLLFLDGEGEYISDYYYAFELWEEEKGLSANPKDSHFILSFDDNGFVQGRFVTKERYDRICVTELAEAITEGIEDA